MFTKKLLIASICVYVATCQCLHFASAKSYDYDSSQDEYEVVLEEVKTAAQNEDKARALQNKQNNELSFDDNHSDSASLDYADEDDDSEETDKLRNKEWDVLIFTQQWPVTTCYHWKETDESKQCLLPKRQEFWTIHGVWPTKIGTIGPTFCNHSAEFDVNQLKTILDQLKVNWPDIDAQKTYDWLWQHEWIKHGTCAQVLETLDNELKYFNQAINWHGQYLASNLLGSAGIHPDSNNTIDALQSALYKSLGKNAYVHCIFDGKTQLSFLSEIRICFDKTLQLVDCNGVIANYDGLDAKGITNCHAAKLVHYPSRVPPVPQTNREEHKPSNKWNISVVKLYKLVKLIMMLTF